MYGQRTDACLATTRHTGRNWEIHMIRRRFVLPLIACSLLVACANPERSRDLANPAIAAVTIAQQVCSDCHGVTGNAVSPNFPNLAVGAPRTPAAASTGRSRWQARR